MRGVYSTSSNGLIAYNGSSLFPVINDVSLISFPAKDMEKRFQSFRTNLAWAKLSRINHQIFMSANSFFHDFGALFTILPLTTRMISSPGAVYGREAINYTTDTSPITLKWFDLDRTAFLSESSQIYLELALTPPSIHHVYSIYNSFRKESADITHLSEFHHIEYEGKVNQKQNLEIAVALIRHIIEDLLSKSEPDLLHFLSPSELNELGDFSVNLHKVPNITFADALECLFRDTKDDKYLQFTASNFGAWEEIRLTEIFNNMVCISYFPLLEVPFYHSSVPNSSPPVADNTDIIWPGYREILGSGHRVESKLDLEEKARIFQLPTDDYRPYMESRESSDYVPTSGFGMGWERIVHGILKLPFIWLSTHFPRGHTTLRP